MCREADNAFWINVHRTSAVVWFHSLRGLWKIETTASPEKQRSIYIFIIIIIIIIDMISFHLIIYLLYDGRCNIHDVIYVCVSVVQVRGMWRLAHWRTCAVRTQLPKMEKQISHRKAYVRWPTAKHKKLTREWPKEWKKKRERVAISATSAAARVRPQHHTQTVEQ